MAVIIIEIKAEPTLLAVILGAFNLDDLSARINQLTDTGRTRAGPSEVNEINVREWHCQTPLLNRQQLSAARYNRLGAKSLQSQWFTVVPNF